MANSEEQKKYTLTITKNNVTSTCNEFDLNDLSKGDFYRPLSTYFEPEGGKPIKRNTQKGERKISNQTLPRLAFQNFERNIRGLSESERLDFPVCKYGPDYHLITGIFPSVEEFHKSGKKSLEYMRYKSDDGREFVIYCWNIFSTINFVQECLKRFGKDGDQFVLIYRDKTDKELHKEIDFRKSDSPEIENGKEESISETYRNEYSPMLLSSKNMILRGAPGTGKSYLAKEIAADIVSKGFYSDFSDFPDEYLSQVEFVQFHPSYDYTDFVEGLRPYLNDDGTMGFELRDGIFKQFVEKARTNYENSQKSRDVIEKENTVKESIEAFLSGVDFDKNKFYITSGNEFSITDIDDKYIYISIPNNEVISKLKVYISELQKMLESDEKFDKLREIKAFFGKKYVNQRYSYMLELYRQIRSRKNTPSKNQVKQEELKNYVFIIDEINRGEISKIFGELFYSIDPGYRGLDGAVSTQYSNLHEDPDEKFYIPENLYIIGTMNDIDRSVDSFDFAMRRRFRFVELKADECLEMLDLLEDDNLKEEAISRMAALNKEIAAVDDLNENYQIGASYFLKLKELTFDQLWTDYLRPLLQEYVQGMYDEESIMDSFAKAYGYKDSAEGESNESIDS